MFYMFENKKRYKLYFSENNMEADNRPQSM